MTRVRFIRNFTLEPIHYWIERDLRASGLQIQCEFGDYAGAANEIEALPDEDALVVLALGLEMGSTAFGHFDWDAEAGCARHLAMVRSAVARGGALVINTVLPPLHDAFGGANHGTRPAADEFIDELNVELRRLAASNPTRVTLCDWGRIARQLGAAATYDQRFWRTSAAPFSGRFLAQYARTIAGTLRVRSGKVKKCLVLDCDNTLWGGIVGEDGIDGIQLSEDTLPGAYFREFQRSVLDLQKRGVLLALASKNNEADVLEVLDQHPDCLIKRAHLAAWRVGWNDKATSIAALAAELDIGMDAMVFVDDSQVECELVAQALPEVTVLRVPESPVDLVGFLERERPFESITITEADGDRTLSYQQNRARRLAADEISDPGVLKRSLQTRLVVRPARAADTARIAQLLQRTNQFNLTTRRHSAEALQSFLASPDSRVLCAELSDRFGDLGLIGVCIVHREGGAAVIDSLLMSCRALGRDAEFAFVAGVMDLLDSTWDGASLKADYVPSARNSQTADFWDRVGLERTGSFGDGAVSYAATTHFRQRVSALCPSHVTLEINR